MYSTAVSERLLSLQNGALVHLKAGEKGIALSYVAISDLLAPSVEEAAIA